MNLPTDTPQVPTLTRDDITKAIALFYDGQQAPEVIAKGDDGIAADILEIAQENEIPIYNNPALAELLYRLEIGEHIPRELYLTVAHIIAFVYGVCNEDIEGNTGPADDNKGRTPHSNITSESSKI